MRVMDSQAAARLKLARPGGTVKPSEIRFARSLPFTGGAICAQIQAVDSEHTRLVWN